MAKALRAFFARVAIDPVQLARFLTDPAGTLEAGGMSQDDIDAVGTGDRNVVYARLTDQHPPFGGATSTPPRLGGPERPAPGREAKRTGSLVVVGTGIRTLGQLTVEAISHIQMADKVVYVVSCPIAEELIHDLNPQGAESMSHLYGEGKERGATYAQMTDRILSCVRAGLATCAAFYGHPGVFVTPAHEAIRRARAEGFSATMLPGISAEDCLFADLGFDPAISGCQTFEATEFLLRPRLIDPSSALILWQIGVMDWAYRSQGYSMAALPLLLDRLYRFYHPWHLVYVYEAAVYPGCEPVIKPVPLFRLGEVEVFSSSTLFIPPARPPEPDPVMHQRFGAALTWSRSG